ncbi:WxcM-like domain-containing protein [Helicobacter sp. MIT 11-5569]|uniref:sugar 3,4-ketoisomerase n=1 Tax=Helicobacter sp. MIT 11-5569 TaxID=1548151 RepID=UPI00068AC2D7|nr:FdtA/QdtA family cupin domain-containing protein [Helicobacter sp. MIT 11-5569]TLD81159.1 WxcM-like domain-containing protein [Helicobacter sp. MIT 11-5569]
MNYKILTMHAFSDERGKLVALESRKNVPFDIKRVYYIFDASPEFDRGGHAHTNLEQIMICLAGSCEILLDNGKIKEKVILDSPEVGLYIGKNMWRVMKNFSYDCRLVVLASDFYDENEYIRDYGEFIGLVKEGIGEKSNDTSSL